VAGAELGQQDPSAPALDQIGAHHLIDPIVCALNQDFRLQRTDQLDRRVLAEHDDEIDRAQ
jgi:hypothetical protein